MLDHARGGDDIFTAGGAGGSYTFYGDAGGEMSGDAVGGNDTFTGHGDSTNLAYGDALTMSGHAQGGDDILMGGNDLTAPSAVTFGNVLIGDAETIAGHAHGGNDTLISGTGNDDMFGDAKTILEQGCGGNDSFVFSSNNGHDRIEDFGQGVHGVTGLNWGTDHIDVSALGIHDFSELIISAFDPVTHESTITFGTGNDVVVHSQIALMQQNFVFAP